MANGHEQFEVQKELRMIKEIFSKWFIHFIGKIIVVWAVLCSDVMRPLAKRLFLGEVFIRAWAELWIHVRCLLALKWVYSRSCLRAGPVSISWLDSLIDQFIIWFSDVAFAFYSTSSFWGALCCSSATQEGPGDVWGDSQVWVWTWNTPAWGR